jgi:hypothetical protein
MLTTVAGHLWAPSEGWMLPFRLGFPWRPWKRADAVLPCYQEQLDGAAVKTARVVLLFGKRVRSYIFCFALQPPKAKAAATAGCWPLPETFFARAISRDESPAENWPCARLSRATTRTRGPVLLVVRRQDFWGATIDQT